MFIYHIWMSSSENEKRFRQKLYRKSKHSFISNNFFFSENRAVYEIKWKNTVQHDGTDDKIRRMRTACWITNATDTHS
jgi:hypothetical protein